MCIRRLLRWYWALLYMKELMRNPEPVDGHYRIYIGESVTQGMQNIFDRVASFSCVSTHQYTLCSFLIFRGYSISWSENVFYFIEWSEKCLFLEINILFYFIYLFNFFTSSLMKYTFFTSFDEIKIISTPKVWIFFFIIYKIY